MIIKNITIKTREDLGHTYYMVIGDTEKFGEQEILFEGIHLYECKKYLKKEGVPDTQIKEVILYAKNSELLKEYSPKAFNGMYTYFIDCTSEFDLIEAKTDFSAINKGFKFAKDNDLVLNTVSKSLYDKDGEEWEEALTVYDREIGRIKY